jgi:hypothetical protein
LRRLIRLSRITLPVASFIVPEILPCPLWAWANEPKIRRWATTKDRIALVAICFTLVPLRDCHAPCCPARNALQTIVLRNARATCAPVVPVTFTVSDRAPIARATSTRRAESVSIDSSLSCVKTQHPNSLHHLDKLLIDLSRSSAIDGHYVPAVC